MNRNNATWLMATCLVCVQPVSAQPVITFEDAQNWTTARFLYYSYPKHDTVPCPYFWQPRYDFLVDTGMVWDFRNAPFCDTVEWVIRSPTASDLDSFPGTNRVDSVSFDFIAEYWAFSPMTSMLTLGSGVLTRHGLDFHREWGTARERYAWPDTTCRFPLTYGDAWRSHMYYGRLPGVDSSLYRTAPSFEVEWVERAANAYGKVVLPPNDTVQVIGVREVGLVNDWRGSAKYDWGMHTYSWIAPGIGVVASAAVWADSSLVGADVDTTIMKPGVATPLCAVTVTYSLVRLVLRLPSPGQSVAPHGATPARLALGSQRAGQSALFDMRGRRLGTGGARTEGAVFVLADGGFTMVCLGR